MGIQRGHRARPLEWLAGHDPAEQRFHLGAGSHRHVKREGLIPDLKRDNTIVIVTHNMQQAARIPDDTAFLHPGELIAHDRTRALFSHPATKQTEDCVTDRFG